MDMTSCPECGEPAEIVDRHVLESTDGPIEHARVRCVQRHHFFMPVGRLASAASVVVRRRSESTR
jgi:negative regulator of sigma E activity